MQQLHSRWGWLMVGIFIVIVITSTMNTLQKTAMHLLYIDINLAQ